MAIIEDPLIKQLERSLALKCKACDWVLTHKNVMYGHCPRCGRYIQV